MKVAILGCCHGALDTVYEELQRVETRSECKIDLLICCGDFQAVRDLEDLNCMAVDKDHSEYRRMESFYKYYSGEKTAPLLTIFIGGNHEASNHLFELGYGGWVAPNIYFLGYAGVVRFGGLRIAGISGIYSERHYRLNRFEFPPYGFETERSTYHTRRTDVFRLKQLTGNIDIMLSHDWPQGICRYGNIDELKHRYSEFDESRLNPAAMELLQHHKPTYWFSAHVHVKFAALYCHTPSQDAAMNGDNSIRGDVVRREVARGAVDSITVTPAEWEVGEMAAGSVYTKFLALHKAEQGIQGNEFLQILEIPSQDSSKGPYQLEYDKQWLAILKSTEPLMKYDEKEWPLPSNDSSPHCRVDFTPTEEEVRDVEERFQVKGCGQGLVIPKNFSITVPPYKEGDTSKKARTKPQENPQTIDFCRKLDITNPFKPRVRPVFFRATPASPNNTETGVRTCPHQT